MYGPKGMAARQQRAKERLDRRESEKATCLGVPTEKLREGLLAEKIAENERLRAVLRNAAKAEDIDELVLLRGEARRVLGEEE